MCERLHTVQVLRWIVWLFVGGTSDMEVVVLGGHVIVGLSRKGIAPPGLATLSRIEMVMGGNAHVCM